MRRRFDSASMDEIKGQESPDDKFMFSLKCSRKDVTSMNDSEMYEYDYNSTCEQDPSGDFPSLPVLYYMLSCLGVLGNSTVLWVLLVYIKLKTMTDVCLLNLALSDLMLAVSLPLWASESQNLVTCKLLTGVYQLGFYSGTLFVTLMSVDRYLAIVHAVTAMRARTLRYGIAGAVATWLVSVAMAAPQVTFAGLEEEDGRLMCQPLYPPETLRFWKLARNFSENSVGLFLCLPLLVFCYASILLVLSKSRNSNRGKAVRLIFAIVCVFAVCWVPYNVAVFLQTLQLFGTLDDCAAAGALGTGVAVAEVIALSHCCVNPVIYAFIGEKFRKPLAKVLRAHGCWRTQGGGRSRDTTEKDTSNTAVRSDH